MKAMGHEIDDISAILKDSAYKQVSKIQIDGIRDNNSNPNPILQRETADGSGMEITEYFMGAKKCFSFKYNEEFDYERPGVF